MLVDIGKAMPREEWLRANFFSMFCSILFGKLKVAINNENRLVKGKKDNIERPVNYVAYKITYENYCNFLATLKYINAQIHVPIVETENEVTFKFQKIDTYERNSPFLSTPQVERLCKHAQMISVKHNCREAVIDLASLNFPQNTHLPISSPLVFLSTFPAQIELKIDILHNSYLFFQLLLPLTKIRLNKKYYLDFIEIIHNFLLFFKKIRPRYLLSLDSQFYSLSQKAVVYRFKVFGEHTFPKFTFDDIKNSKNILHDIHQVDLMKITTENYVISQKKNTLITVLNNLNVQHDTAHLSERFDIEHFFKFCKNRLLI